MRIKKKVVDGKPVKVSPPSFFGVNTCEICGGLFEVVADTNIISSVSDSGEVTLSVVCPYCGTRTRLRADVNKALREKLDLFIYSQVGPIKAISNDNIRIPMQKLLDDFYVLVHEGE